MCKVLTSGCCYVNILQIKYITNVGTDSDQSDALCSSGAGSWGIWIIVKSGQGYNCSGEGTWRACKNNYLPINTKIF